MIDGSIDHPSVRNSDKFACFLGRLARDNRREFTAAWECAWHCTLDSTAAYTR